jgi:hypothetical protein
VAKKRAAFSELNIKGQQRTNWHTMSKLKETERDHKFDRELALIEHLRWSRKEFLDRICSASASAKDAVIAVLRLEATYQFAEFLFLLRAQGIERDIDIGRLADLHNQYIVDLIKSPEKMNRLGVSRERVLEAMFTGDTLPRLLQNWRDKPGAIDQSNLARFLMGVMSTETCRKVVVACTEAGFLERTRTPYGTMVVCSTGKLENLYALLTRELDARLRD